MVRDNALAVTGLLSTKIGGPSVKPYQPHGYWAYLNFPPREWDDSVGEDQYRRGLYTWWQRAFPQPSLLAFDAPSREECVAERVRSNVPQQALVLLNDPTYVEAARVFAERILREGGTSSRPGCAGPTRGPCQRAAERGGSRGCCGASARRPAASTRPTRHAAAAPRRRGPGTAAQQDLTAVELAAWTQVARAILNLHEMITRSELRRAMEILTDDLRALRERMTRRAFLGRTRRRASAPLALGALLEPQAAPGRAAGGRGSDRGRDAPATFPPRAKRVIHLYQAGGPSHLELFDYKPKLAAMNGKPMPESFTKGQPIAQLQSQKLNCFGPQHPFARFGGSGQEMTTLFPQIGEVADEICIVRSMHDRADQPRPRPHLHEHGHPDLRPAGGGVLDLVRHRGRGRRPAGLRGPHLAGPRRPDAADRGPAVAQRLPPQPLPGRPVPLEGRRRALPARARRARPTSSSAT